MRVLVCGAGIAGPVLAYWLHRYGLTPTVVERAPTVRKTSGHSVDLFGPAMTVVERMGVAGDIRAHATGIDQILIHREGHTRPVRVDLRQMMSAVSDSHVEIMRDELSSILYNASRNDVEYLFGDAITSIAPDTSGVDVSFERAAPRRFDLVIGADGLHSQVRGLVFGPERDYTTFLGTYLAVATVPDEWQLGGRMLLHGAPGRLAGCCGSRHTGDARAGFFFRSAPLDYHHRDTDRQKALVHEAFDGLGGLVPELLARLPDAEAFYFDSITQLCLPTWSQGRVGLVGDAGYCPGPAVGGSTSLAVVGAYVLAGELATAGDDYAAGFAAYQGELGDYARESRTFAVGVARRLVPDTPAQLWAVARGAWLAGHLPIGLTRALAEFGAKGARMHDRVRLKDYRPEAFPTPGNP